MSHMGLLIKFGLDYHLHRVMNVMLTIMQLLEHILVLDGGIVGNPIMYNI